MSLLFADSFQHYSTADRLKKWSSGSATISPTAGRGGRGAMVMASGGSMVRSIATPAQTLIAGFAYKFGGTLMDGPFFSFHQATTYGGVECRIRNDGSISVYRASTNGTTITLLGTSAAGCFGMDYWTHIEIRAVCSTSVGEVQIRANGVTVLSLTGINTDAAASGTFSGLTVGGVSIASEPSGSFSDLYLCSGAGTTNNTFLGDCKVEALTPSSDGATQQFTAVPGGTHYTAIDETPMSTTDYLSGASGQTELNGFTDMTGTPATVFGVQVVSGVAGSDAGALTVRHAVRSAGATYTGAPFALTSSYRYLCEAWETDPATSDPWASGAAVNTAQFGLTVA